MTEFTPDDIGDRVKTLHASPSSDVYIAECKKAGFTELVVKRTKITNPGDMKRFDKELEFLNACEHASVLKPVGVLKSPPTYALVLPVFARGSLFATLHASGRMLSLPAKLHIASDLAGAISHLHDKGILHRDVKSDNVLIHESGRVVLADFNASEWEELITADIMMQARPTGGFFKQFVVGTLPYMAPELLRSVRGAAYARACDVYSLGITLNEVLTQTVPYSDAMTEQVQLHTILEARYNHEALTVAIASDGIRPNTPTAPADSAEARIVSELSATIADMWADAATARPTMGQVASAVAALLQSAVGSTPFDGSTFFVPVEEAAAKLDGAASPMDISADVAASGGAGYGTGAVGGGVKLSEAAVKLSSANGGFSGWSSEDAKVLERVSGSLGLGGAAALKVGWEASSGRRGSDRMEDRTVACAGPGVSLAAVFDGHNGDAAAEYCRVHIAPVVEARCAAAAADVAAGKTTTVNAASAALQSAFVSLNEGFLAGPTADDSGCTALAVMTLPSHVLVANAGDCVCVLWRGDEIVPLSNEHTCAYPPERARIEAAGTTIKQTADGKLRVGGVIQVTRCVGDRPLRHLGLTSEPEMTRIDITPEDKMLVLASDGLWDVLSHARVLHCLKNTAKSPDLIAKRLLTEALDRGTRRLPRPTSQLPLPRVPFLPSGAPLSLT
jgi:serine/threonine protein phosphatase PrpC